MAKKEKTVLTPEELAAKRERKTEKRKIFGDTFIKGLATMLAIVLVYAVVHIAFGQNTAGVQAANGSVVASGTTSGGTTSGGTTSGGSSEPVAAPVEGAQEIADLINKTTADAVSGKVGYDWERHCKVENIDVGSATGTLNSIIQGISPEDDLNSVVGGFLGRGDKKETVPKGQTLDTIDVKKDDGTTEKLYHGSNYTLKATQLQAADLQNLKVDGDTYTFTIPNTTNPGRDTATPLSRFTNDIVVLDEVNTEIKNQVSVVNVNDLTANYKNIQVTVVITDGKLVSLEYSLEADAQLALKALVVNINGSGDLTANAKYSNFAY